MRPSVLNFQYNIYNDHLKLLDHFYFKNFLKLIKGYRSNKKNHSCTL